MTNQTHKLAAIVFTDIVGYTRQMEKDEQLTVQLLQKQRELIFPLGAATKIVTMDNKKGEKIERVVLKNKRPWNTLPLLMKYGKRLILAINLPKRQKQSLKNLL